MIKQEILDELTDFIKQKFSLNDLYRVDSFITLEKDVKKSFKLENQLAFVAFVIHGNIAKTFIDIPLKCQLLPNDFKTYKLVSTNLLTGEIVDESLRILGRNIIEPGDQFEFWTVWISNPYNDDFQKDKKVMVVTLPLDLGQTEKKIDPKQDKEIKLNF